MFVKFSFLFFSFFPPCLSLSFSIFFPYICNI
jgi:hypothetical protein